MTPRTCASSRRRSLDELVGRSAVALACVLRADEHAADVLEGTIGHRRRRRGDACRPPDARAGRRSTSGLPLDHRGERDVLARLGCDEDEAGVLLREEALGDRRVEHQTGRPTTGHRSHQGRAAGGRSTKSRPRVVAALSTPSKLRSARLRSSGPAAWRVAVQEAARTASASASARRRADTAIGHGHGDRELAEQPADDAAHEQQRDEHRDQRDGDRDDGEADLADALERRVAAAASPSSM